MRTLLFIIVFFITYGSLYPFNFESSDFSYHGLTKLIFASGGLFRISDLISNVVLFIPYGIVSFFISVNSENYKLKLFYLITFGIAFSIFLQILQIYLPSRVVAFSDVIWNLLGIFIGIILSFIFRIKILFIESKVGYLYSPQVFLIACWVASALIPFIPTLQVDQVRDNIKELAASSIYIDAILFQIIGWLICLYLFISVSNKTFIYYLLVIFTLIAKIFLVDNVLTLNIIIGAMFVVLFGGVVCKYIKIYRFYDLMPFLIIVMIMLHSFTPLSLNDELNDFHWVPFSGFLEGSMLINAQSLCEKTFIYGSLVWLLKISSAQIKIATIFVALVLLFVEIMQIFIGDGTPEITDPLFVFLIAYILNFIETTKVIKEKYKQKPVASLKWRKESRAKVSVQIPHCKMGVEASFSNKTSPNPSLLRRGTERLRTKVSLEFPKESFKSIYVPYLIVLSFFSILIKIILSYPQIPYNVKEMFLGGGNFLAVFVFLNALFWVGGSAVICAFLTQRSKYRFLALPGYVVLSGLISLSFLYLSITEETISDIVGSSNVNWFVINQNMWGETWSRILFNLDAPGLVGFFERIVRYLALYSPVTFLLVIAVSIFNQDRLNIKKSLVDLFYLILISIPWLYICKIIAFTYSSTDNLNELIAPPGEYDMGGGGYIYVLLLLISFNSVLLSKVNTSYIFKLLGAVVITLLMIPIGWYLLNAGLVTGLSKYGLVYSGVDFILGPDRTTLLSNEMLFFRWSIVQLSIVFILSYGQRLMLKVLHKIGGNKYGYVEQSLA